MAKTRTVSRIVAATALAGMLLTGCSSDSTADSGGVEGAYDDSGAAYAEQAEAAADSDGSSVADTGARLVIQTGWMTLSADDPVAVADRVVDIVEQAGGRTDNRNVVQASEYRSPYASLTVRIPADQLDGVLAQIEDEAELLESAISAEDVTLASQDLDARIGAKELSIERLEELLASATTSADIIAAEDTLTQRQSELEQLKAEKAWLSEQVALSTITVDISAPDQIPVTRSPGFFGGLARGWASLVSAVNGLLVTLGFLLPWLVVIGVVGGGIWLFARSRRANSPAPATATTAANAGHLGTGAQLQGAAQPTMPPGQPIAPSQPTTAEQPEEVTPPSQDPPKE